VVRDSLHFDPSKIEDRDLKEILNSLAGIIGGIGALRTHASSAHGAGKIFIGLNHDMLASPFIQLTL